MSCLQTLKIGNIDWYILKTIGSRYFLLSESPLYKGYYSLQPGPYIDSKIAQFISNKFVSQLEHRGVDISKINNASILTAGQYKMYVKDKLPNTTVSYMLQTAHPTKSDCVLAVNPDGEIYPMAVRDSCGIRPCMFIDKEYADSMNGIVSENSEEMTPDPKFANFSNADSVQSESCTQVSAETTPFSERPPKDTIPPTEPYHSTSHSGPVVSVVIDMISKKNSANAESSELRIPEQVTGKLGYGDNGEVKFDKKAETESDGRKIDEIRRSQQITGKLESDAGDPPTIAEDISTQSDSIQKDVQRIQKSEDPGMITENPTTESIEHSQIDAEASPPASDEQKCDHGADTQCAAKIEQAASEAVKDIADTIIEGQDIDKCHHTESGNKVQESCASVSVIESAENVVEKTETVIEEPSDVIKEAESVITAESGSVKNEDGDKESDGIDSASETTDNVEDLLILEMQKVESEIPEADISAGQQTIKVTQVGREGNTHAVYLFSEEEFRQYAVLYEGGEEELRQVMNEYGIVIYDFLRSSVNENRKVVTREDVMNQVRSMQKKWRWREK